MRGARGFAAGVLTLVALQVLGSGKGPEQGGKLLVWVAGGLRRALSPEVAAIPSTGKKAPAKPPAKKDSGVGGSLPRNPTITT